MSRLYFHPVRYACNKSCSFCITKQQVSKTSKFPSYINPYKLDDISEYIFNTYSEIEITGGGEPTLHPNFLSILEILSQYNNKDKKLYTKAYTNRTNMNIISNNKNIAELTYSYEDIIDFFNNINDISKYTIYAKQRARIYCKNAFDMSYILENYSDRLLKLGIQYNLKEIILGLDFNEIVDKYTYEYMKKFQQYYTYIDKTVKLTTDLHEKQCTKYNILYTNGLIYNTWDSLIC